MKHLLLLTLLLTACSTTMTRLEDAGVDAQLDVFITPDAAPDARLPSDAFTPDSSEPDAYVRSGEGCNGLDDDFDGLIDEETPTALCDATYACISATCQCPPGVYACGTASPLLCDVTDITTREHCGGCMPCDPSEDCSTEGGTPHCAPARITDFTSSGLSAVTCIIREQDQHTVCREFDGWVDLGMRAIAVRAWQQIVCVVAEADYHVHCRGGDDPTGLLVTGPLVDGWSRLPFMVSPDRAYFMFSIEGGEGIVGDGSDAIVWGGRHSPRRARFVTGERVRSIGDGTRRFVVLNDDSSGVYRLDTWGTAFPALSSAPWTDSLGGAADRAVLRTVDAQVSPEPWHQVWCYGDYCCAYIGFSVSDLQCWGGTGSEIQLVSLPFGTPRIFPTPEGVRICVDNRCMQASQLHDPGAVPEDDPQSFAATMDEAMRNDWRANCIRNHTTGGFDCYGMHTGWPIP